MFKLIRNLIALIATPEVATKDVHEKEWQITCEELGTAPYTHFCNACDLEPLPAHQEYCDECVQEILRDTEELERERLFHQCLCCNNQAIENDFFCQTCLDEPLATAYPLGD